MRMGVQLAKILPGLLGQLRMIDRTLGGVTTSRVGVHSGAHRTEQRSELRTVDPQRVGKGRMAQLRVQTQSNVVE